VLRRTFLKSGGATALLTGAASAFPHIPKFPLPKDVNWKGLKLKAELEVKGQRCPVRWACHQKLDSDGSLSLRPTVGLGQNDVTGGV
jgi:hypothetical protein